MLDFLSICDDAKLSELNKAITITKNPINIADMVVIVMGESVLVMAEVHEPNVKKQRMDIAVLGY